jgi:hypothetical protein
VKDELRAYKTMAENRPDRFTAGRYLQALSLGKGSVIAARAYVESQGQWWGDQGKIIGALEKAAVAGMGTGDVPDSNAVAEAFLSAMRDFSIPLRLQGLRRVPLRTRVFASSTGVLAVRVLEGTGIPVLRGDWTSKVLEPLKHAGITVQTDELIRSSSPLAAAAITDDLARAVAEAENETFLVPSGSDSVLYGRPNFISTGSSLAQVDADLKRLIDLVPHGAAFTMSRETATALAFLRGTGGARAYPDIAPEGGQLLNMPVLISKACALVGSPVSRMIALLAPGEIVYADEGAVALTTSNAAALEMVDTPTGDSLAPTPGEVVSLFQTASTALKGLRESAWFARSGSGAYYTCGY